MHAELGNYESDGDAGDLSKTHVSDDELRGEISWGDDNETDMEVTSDMGGDDMGSDSDDDNELNNDDEFMLSLLKDLSGR